jgi:hypothetical protein
MFINHLSSRRKSYDELFLRDQRIVHARDGQTIELYTEHVPGFLNYLIRQGADETRNSVEGSQASQISAQSSTRGN